MDEKTIRKIVQDEISKSQRDITARTLTDTPTDSLSVVNRRYVTLNGPTASRPGASVLGQSYFDTNINKPVWWNGSTWKLADGTNG